MLFHNSTEFKVFISEIKIFAISTSRFALYMHLEVLDFTKILAQNIIYVRQRVKYTGRPLICESLICGFF